MNISTTSGIFSGSYDIKQITSKLETQNINLILKNIARKFKAREDFEFKSLISDRDNTYAGKQALKEVQKYYNDLGFNDRLIFLNLPVDTAATYVAISMER